MPMTLGLATTQKQSFVLQQSITMLRMSTPELSDFLAGTAQENPLLLVECPRRRLFIRNSTTDALESLAGEQAPSLYAHVTADLGNLLAKGGLLAQIVGALIEELEPTGWIGAPLAEIAGKLGIAETHVASVLTVVQKRVDPAGLFARNLRECLQLQLEADGKTSPEMLAVLNQLGVLEQRGIAALAREAGIEREAAQDCIAILRRLDPKPGARFTDDPALGREPDAKVMRGPHGWEVVFNTAAQPVVTIAPLPRGARQSADIARMLKQAQGIRQAVALRWSATQKVVAELVRRQQDYFDRGPEALRPLGMDTLAAAIGFHASTISRVLNGYLIEGPRGVTAARDLCPQAASTRQGAHSKAQVMARLRAILAAEDKRNPIRDARLKELLLSEGIAISRRMAAKYRHVCGFAPAALRRSEG